MADASAALGAVQIAGTWVNRRGTAKKLVSTVAGRELGGAVGSVAAGRIADRCLMKRDTPELAAKTCRGDCRITHRPSRI
jgi:hypothetical protein